MSTDLCTHWHTHTHTQSAETFGHRPQEPFAGLAACSLVALFLLQPSPELWVVVYPDAHI